MVLSYRIVISDRAERALSGISRADQKRITAKIDALAHTPRPSGVAPLKGTKNPPLLRIRVGDYRVL